ncbi:NAD(P)-dependent alcohol dehydrogenase [Nocardia sp. NPDC051570]|uniref:NAD(P)-dependent alcohol dehydrogenase n=1 Tax=Nocardia sp. NPDC051570 TaxID=3364324 RepID=UPI003788E1C2
MRAWRLLEWKSEPVLMDIPEPEPGPGQVVIKVGGSGACHSDLHLMRDFDIGTVPWNPAFTLGHEIAGWVHALGDGVTDLEIGLPVAVHGAWGCGACARCRVGAENYCEDPVAAPIPAGGCGLGLDGGMADYVLVPDARYLLPLPDGLDPVQAAPLTDAGLTPYHAVRRSWPKLQPGSTAVVIGVGGLGHLAVQILAATTAARIIAVDNRADARALAEKCGADLTVDPADDTAAQIRDVAHGRGADVILDFVGTTQTLALGAQSARSMGDLTLVGLAGGTLPLSFFATAYEVSVQTVYWGTRPDLVEVLDLAGRGQLTAAITTSGLDDMMDVYRRMEAGEITGRVVITP